MLVQPRHNRLTSSPAEKDLTKKFITVDTWMNVKQHHVHITNKSNYVMSFARGIISSRLKKINICLYLVLATSTILGSVLVLPFQKQWQENWRVFSSGLPT